MTEYQSLRHAADGTPAPLSCWKSTLAEAKTEEIFESRDDAACLEVAAVLNVDRDRVSIQNRALMAGAIYPFFYEVSLDSSGGVPYGDPSLRMAVTPDLQVAFLTFLSPELARVDDVVNLLRAHWVPSPDAASIHSTMTQAASRNGPVPWLRIPASDTML